MIGDFTPGKTVRLKWNTADPTGAPVTASSVTIKVYKDGSSTTESTTGVTHTEDFDSTTGLHDVAIDTSADGTFYSAGSDFTVIATAATVNGVSVPGLILESFSISNRSALRPATADRTLVVDSAGLADANMVKAGPTGSGAAQTAGDIIGDTNDIQARLPAALVSGRIDASVGAVASGVIAAASFAANALDAVWSTTTRLLSAGTNIVLAKGTGVTGFNDLDASGVRSAVGLASANLDTQIAAVQSDTDNIQTRLPATLTGAGNIKSDAQVVSDKTGYALVAGYDPAKTAAQAGDAMALTSGERTSTATAVWASAARSLTTFGTLVSDIWAAVVDSAGVTTLLARLTGTRAGYLDNLSAGAVALEATAQSVKTKTDNLPSDPADESQIIAATDALATAIAALNNLSSAQVSTVVSNALAATVPDSVPAVGTRPSINASAYLAFQYFVNRDVSGTTETIYKPDGTTALATATLDSATAPTAVTRAS